MLLLSLFDGAYSRYTRPTPVQKWAIPIIMGGRDLMVRQQVVLSGRFFTYSSFKSGLRSDWIRKDCSLSLPCDFSAFAVWSSQLSSSSCQRSSPEQGLYSSLVVERLRFSIFFFSGVSAFSGACPDERACHSDF